MSLSANAEDAREEVSKSSTHSEPYNGLVIQWPHKSLLTQLEAIKSCQPSKTVLSFVGPMSKQVKHCE